MSVSLSTVVRPVDDVAFREIDRDRVELTTPDAMEFLYTYTWGPAVTSA